MEGCARRQSLCTAVAGKTVAVVKSRVIDGRNSDQTTVSNVKTIRLLAGTAFKTSTIENGVHDGETENSRCTYYIKQTDARDFSPLNVNTMFYLMFFHVS